MTLFHDILFQFNHHQMSNLVIKARPVENHCLSNQHMNFTCDFYVVLEIFPNIYMIKSHMCKFQAANAIFTQKHMDSTCTYMINMCSRKIHVHFPQGSATQNIHKQLHVKKQTDGNSLSLCVSQGGRPVFCWCVGWSDGLPSAHICHRSIASLPVQNHPKQPGVQQLISDTNHQLNPTHWGICDLVNYTSHKAFCSGFVRNL